MAAAAMTGCTGSPVTAGRAATSSHSPAGGPSSAGAGAATPGIPRITAPASPAELLRDSWVRSGRSGYFVDDAWDPSSPAFSLYLTVWNAALDRAAGVPTGLDGRAVSRWTQAASIGQQPGSGLPPLAQITFASRLISLAHGTIDTTRVTAAVESLRSGGQYRSAPSVTSDWGSTTVAAETLHALGSAIPAPVVTGYRHALDGAALDAPLDPQAVSDTWLPVIQGVALLRDELTPAERARAARLVVLSASAISHLPAGAVRLSASDELTTAAAALALPVPDLAVNSWCASLVDPGGRITVPGLDAGDPQITLAAFRLGCAGVRPPTDGAPSRSGWPTTSARSNRLPATVAGLRLAGSLGLARQFTTRLRVYAERLPPIDASDAFRALEVAQLRRALGLAAPQIPTPHIGSSTHADSALSWAVTAGLTRPRHRAALVSALTTYARSQTHPTIVSVALDEQVGRLTGRASWHARARSGLADLAGPGGSTRLAPGRSELSLTAELVATWIDRRTLSSTALRRWGLCADDLCVDTPAGSLDDRPTTTLAIQAERQTCAVRACGGIFPLVL